MDQVAPWPSVHGQFALAHQRWNERIGQHRPERDLLVESRRLTGLDEPLLIDEVQRGGNPLILAVKSQLDRSPWRGRFVLAGSTRFLSEPRLSESLAGRVRFVDLWPLSQGEIGGGPDRFIDLAFEQPASITAAHVDPLTRTPTVRASGSRRASRGSAGPLDGGADRILT